MNPHPADPTSESHFATWNAAHYPLLANQGFPEAVGSCAVYPLWRLICIRTPVHMVPKVC
jgi:hypothetical protein